MEKQIKSYIAEVEKINKESKEITVVVSTGSVDRDKEIILPSAFSKNLGTYLAHPILISSHISYSDLRKQIGEATAVTITEKGVQATFKYYAGLGNPEADWAWVLATQKIAAFSIGFIPKAWEDSTNKPDAVARRTFTEIELMEISQVLIPANQDAVQERRNVSNVEPELLELACKAFASKELTAPVVEKKADVVPAEEIKKVEETIDSEEIKHYTQDVFGDGSLEHKHTPKEADIKTQLKEISDLSKGVFI